MPTKHVVKPGECIFTIANEARHRWETIWDDPGNSALRELREAPGILLPGDEVQIPDPRLLGPLPVLYGCFVQEGPL